jgi:hypothetical protein
MENAPQQHLKMGRGDDDDARHGAARHRIGQ